MAKSGHNLHPVICRSDTHELWVVVVACGGYGEAFRENEHSCRKRRVEKCNRNATTGGVRETRRPPPGPRGPAGAAPPPRARERKCKLLPTYENEVSFIRRN